jgi:sodium/hydrogen antiporter
MSQLDLALTTIGLAVLALGLVSRLIKRRLWISEPLLALLAGVALGPAALGWLEPETWGRQDVILEETIQITLAIALMEVALRLPRGHPMRAWRSLALMLVVVMPLMALTTGLLAGLLLGLPFLSGLLLGAVLIPTDPVVSGGIVSGDFAVEHLPARIRHLISAESGANDGLAAPLVFLPLLLLYSSGLQDALIHWIGRVVLWETMAAILFGAVLGYLAGRLLHFAEDINAIENPSFLAYTVALSLLTLGAGRLLEVSALITVFSAGVAFDTVIGGRERAEEENVQEAFNRFFTLPAFILLGIVLPWDGWLALGWSGVALAAGVLLLRRLPFVLSLKPFIRELEERRDALFVGWFGPLGLAAVYYAIVATRRTGVEDVWVVGTLVVAVSLAAHGVTATPFTYWYDRAGSQRSSTGRKERTAGSPR